MNNLITRDLGEIMRDEMVMKERILTRLRRDPATITEIAADLKLPAHNVMYWMMTMWRYGLLEETGKPDDDGYYRYRTVQQG